jgi:uncharacterized protein YbbC (DUF1343 family)
MKTLFLTLILTLVFGGFIETQAQTKVKLGVNKQKTVTADRLKIKFVSLIEDSRCPTDVNCIWAGNAKIQIKVTNRRGAMKFFDLNTNGQPQAADFSGWYIKLETLTPAPKSNIRINKNGYTATFSISRLTR